MRQVDAAHAIDLGHQDLELVADVDHVLDSGHTMVGQLGDVDQALFAGQDLDEGAEWHDPRDLARVDLASRDLAGQRTNPIDGFLGVLGVVRADIHRTVVLDVDAGLGLLGDLADDLAAWADDVADLVRVDLDRGDAWGEATDFGARLGDHLSHLVQDHQATFARLCQGLLQDLLGEPGDLDVHLD